MPGQVPVVVAPGAGQTIEGPAGGPLTFKARSEQTGGALTVFENVIAPGDGPPLHIHANADEAWYVLEGELRFRLDAETASAPAGSFVSSSLPATTVAPHPTNNARALDGHPATPEEISRDKPSHLHRTPAAFT